jgi:hypothetical protein
MQAESGSHCYKVSLMVMRARLRDGEMLTQFIEEAVVAAMVQNEPARPIDISLLRADRVVQRSQARTQLIQ